MTTPDDTPSQVRSRAGGAPPDGSGAGSLAAVLARGLWLGLLLTALRAGVFFAMEHVAHGTDVPRALLRLAAALPSMVALGAGLGVGTALVHRGAARVGTPVLVLAVLAAAVLFQPYLAGTFEDESRRIGWDTPRGEQANQLLAAGAAFLALALALVSRRPRPGGALRVALPLALLAALPVAFDAAYGSFEERMLLREVVVEIPLAEPELEVVRGRDDAPPRLDVITPSLDYEVDGADMPAIVLPPPATVRVPVEGPDGTLWLEGRAGIDHAIFKRPKQAQRLAGHRVRFTHAINGDEVFRHEAAVESLGVEQGVLQGTAWVDATGPDGLPVRVGDELELATVLLDASGREVEHPLPLDCGFGGLTLERRREVPRTKASPERPNIVLVVMDTQRADRLDLYGYERATSPRLSALVDRALVYDHAYSASSWTWPSTASILTGRHPQEHGVQDDEACYLVSALETLPEVLQRAGYTTAAFSANPLIVPNKNFDQGFESFEHGRGAFRQSDLVVPAVLEWLEAARDTRFFLYVQLTDPHVPLLPLPEARERFAPDVEPGFPPYMIERANQQLRGDKYTDDGPVPTDELIPPDVQRKIHQQYDACVWTGDHWVGSILDRLDALELTDRTVFVYTSDHGEELFEHGLAEHGKQLYSELVRVPLLLTGPGVPEGVRVTSPVSNRHVAPTLARLAGAEIAGLPDALDLRDPGAARTDDAVFFSTDAGWWNGARSQSIWGLRRGKWVLHFNPEGRDFGAAEPVEGGQWRLFDLEKDPGELDDVSGEHPELCAELREILLDRVADYGSRRVSAGVRAGEGTLEMLRDIGYIGDD